MFEENENFSAFSCIPKVVDKVFVLLHGYGSNSDDMRGLLELFARHFPKVAFYCPNAPEPTLTESSGRQWFPMDDMFPALASMDKEGSFEVCRSMLKGVESARKFIESLIGKITQHHNLQKSDIVLGGFSQGGAVALYTGLSSSDSYAGLMGLSTLANCFCADSIKSRPPVLLTHGLQDEVLPFVSFETTFAKLKELSVPVQGVSVSDMGHAINFEVVRSIRRFLQDIFYPKKADLDKD